MKICLYLEFKNFLGGLFYKKIGTGLLSSYKNQEDMLKHLAIPFSGRWDPSCDILQINTPWFKSIYLMKRAKKLNKKIIVWAHVSPEDAKHVFRINRFIYPAIKKYLVYAYNLADVILCPSEYTKKLMIAHGLPEKKLIVQSNGVDLAKFYKSEEKRKAGRQLFGLDGRLAVGTVGLIIPRKGTDTFLKLAEGFKENKFIWIGKKYNRLMVKSLPGELPANVNFTGFIDDILAGFNALDIFLFPSYEENEGMVILEAAALGLPILVRDIPVYEGWLKHGENCLKAKNDNEFSKYLNELLRDEDLRKKLGIGALALAQSKSKSVLALKLKEVYDLLLKK
ncbi:MAG: glycosyltransferase family 4 protein [Patescibacteria group bacterium]